VNDSKISVRYARALLISAREQDVLSGVREDMEMILMAAKEVHEFKQLLDSPIIDNARKKKVLTTLFENRMQRLSLKFIELVVNKNREEYIPGMARMFIKFYKEEKGIRAATLKTAVKVDKKTKEQLSELIKQVYRSEIELSDEVDERLIGGFVLRVEDQQMDASVAGQLQKIRKELAGNR
jgi:F-type H+-transporting ATPase subunit delta